MRNFGRVLRLALRYKWTLAASIVCALAVGVLWGANFGAIYPFAQLAFKAKNLQEAVELQIAEAEERIAAIDSQVEQLRGELRQVDQGRRREIEGEIQDLADSRQAEQWALAGYRWAKPYVDRYLPSDPLQTLVILIGLLMVGTVVKSAFLVAHTILVSRQAELVTFELRKVFYRRTLRMDLATFTSEGTSDLVARFTNDMRNINDGVSILFGRLIREPLKAICCLVGAGLICWQLLLLSLIIVPVAGLAIRWLGRMLKRANRRAMEEMSQLYSALEETFRGIKIVKAFTMERHERKRFHDIGKAYYRKSMKIARYDSLIHPLTEIMGMVMISLALVAGAALVLDNDTHLWGVRMSSRPLSLASLLLFYGLLAGAADPARKMSDVFTRLQRAAAAADRVYSLLDREPTVRDPVGAPPIGRHHRDLVFDHVTFSYLSGRPVLKDVSLRIEFGETVAIVGPNGCGKSTLANLIPRFADPDEGTIRLDGVPLSEIRLQELRGQIGLVTQEAVLFDDTVFDNIRYGSPRATKEQVFEAAKQAHAHRFIESELGDGYETYVGPMGAQLSGGQRQRIVLARAILRDPAILILDEATSQIDLESEQLIQRVLERFKRGRTTIVITHRLGVLALADRVVVMRDGRIDDVGSHSELLSRCDVYRRLHEIQFEDLRASA